MTTFYLYGNGQCERCKSWVSWDDLVSSPIEVSVGVDGSTAGDAPMYTYTIEQLVCKKCKAQEAKT